MCNPLSNTCKVHIKKDLDLFIFLNLQGSMITTPLGFVDLFQLQPPQLVVHLFVLDVSHNAVEVGYLKYFSESLLKNWDW